MKQKKNINIGFRGWMLLIYQALAFFAFIVFTNYPMNILADMYGGAQKISSLYTACILAGIVVQLILSSFIGKIKKMKRLGVVFGVITMVLALCIMLIPPSQPGAWQVCFGLVCFFSSMWATFSLGILVGQWFPRRKGTIMGIATLAFPIGNGLIGTFAGMVFAKGYPDVFGAFLPFWIICVIGLVIGIIFIKDYPEQCGCYRDNDKSITPEVAKAMMEAEIEAKRTSVWNIKGTLTNRDFWLISVPMGTMLMCCIGIATQSNAILGMFGDQLAPFGGFGGVMLMYAVIGCIGSYALGLFDTKVGTKKAIILSVIFMIISGILGSFHNVNCLIASFVFLGLFTGASSNFTVSAAAQYWRREDFPSVFACVNPVANIIQCIGPMAVAILMGTKGYTAAFTMTAIIGVISLIMALLFSPKHVKEVDDKRREKVGKPLDDALVGRK